MLERFLAIVPDAAGVVATTGKCGRELFTLADRPQHLYQVGSMGGASAMGLGVALHTPRPVVVLDGDGAALMKLGNLATIGSRAPANLVHVVLDNGVHDSTGGQATVSANVDFAAVALACGYASGASCDSLRGFEQALAATRDHPGPHLIHARIAPGSMAKLGRPTIKPPEVARRFRRFLAGPLTGPAGSVALQLAQRLSAARSDRGKSGAAPGRSVGPAGGRPTLVLESQSVGERHAEGGSRCARPSRAGAAAALRDQPAGLRQVIEHHVEPERRARVALALGAGERPRSRHPRTCRLARTTRSNTASSPARGS